MDQTRFDAWTRLLETARSRRTTLRAVAAGTLATALAISGREDAAAKCAKNGKKCKRDTQCCSGHCRRGKCRCSNAGGACTTTADCCGDLVCLRIGAVCAAPA